MKSFLIKLIFFILILMAVYAYFKDYGQINLQLTGSKYGAIEIDAQASVVAVLATAFIIFLSLLAIIIRAIVDLPNNLIHTYKGMRDRKAREILFEIICHKENGDTELSKTLFAKNKSNLLKKNYPIVNLLNYKFFKDINDEETNNTDLLLLANNNVNAGIIFHDFIRPNFVSGNYKFLEMLLPILNKDKNKESIAEIIHAYLYLRDKKFDEAMKSAKKSFMNEGLATENYNSLRAEILCHKVQDLIDNKDYQKAGKNLLEAYQIDRNYQEIFSLIRKIPIKKMDVKQFNIIVKANWKTYPEPNTLFCYLCINGDLSQAKLLDLTEELLKINHSKTAKMIIAAEYYIHGFAKEAAQLLSKINPNTYPSYLRKAVIFREAKSTELKAEKIDKFRNLIFDHNND
jgi:uncharacterized membrane-anchored protein